MKVEFFELQGDDDYTNAPDWVIEAVNSGELQTVQLPLLVDQLVKYEIFKSKTEARNMIKNKGLSLFCYDGPDNPPDNNYMKGPYKTLDGKDVNSFYDQESIVTDVNACWSFIPGDLIRIGKRKFIKMGWNS